MSALRDTPASGPRPPGRVAAPGGNPDARPLGQLVVDVGNTESVVGLFGPDTLTPIATWRYASGSPRTADELTHLLRSFLREGSVEGWGSGAEGPLSGEAASRPGGPTPSSWPTRLAWAAVGSVVPFQTELLRPVLARLVEGSVHVVGPESDLPLRLDVEEPRTVGADRIVNTLAAAHLFARDTIVVDLGTATTYDCITAEGVFAGGIIAPGILAGQEWLAGRTAKLPRVEFEPPSEVIGRRTDVCLKGGLFFSAVDAMDGIVDRLRQAWGRPEVLVVGTGGFAARLAPHSRTLERVEPALTLVGLVLAGRHLEGMAGVQPRG